MLPQTFHKKPPLKHLLPADILTSGIIINDLTILKAFKKQPASYNQMLETLKQRGLTIPHEQKFLHLIKKLSYYRLSGYWYPLLEDKENHVFKLDANFETAFSLYKFDRELRHIVVRELEKIEVAARTQLIDIISHSHSDPFWYANSDNFKDVVKHKDSMDEMLKTFGKNDAQFIKAFKRKYFNPMPPCWMMLELIPFGNLSMLYENLKNSPAKKAVANYFGLDRKTFTSWLHALAYLRNLCAHHARLWNRLMGIQPRIPSKPSKTWLKIIPANNKNYYMFSMILYLLQTIDVKNEFIFKLNQLFDKYPLIDKAALGFPNDWRKEELWKFDPNFGKE